MSRFLRSAILFVAIGLLLYAGTYYAAERLLYRAGHTNAVFKIEQAPEVTFDWVILGASHAMPFNFADFNALMERETGTRILNLATPGVGVIYNQFVLEHFLKRHRTRGVLYVLDSFTFYSRQWNEERFSDAKLIRRTPFSLSLAAQMSAYSLRGRIHPYAVLDYVSGFSKVNDRERLQPDVWEGEARFERTHRFSPLTDKQRIAYLYPFERMEEATFKRYAGQFLDFTQFVGSRHLDLVVIKTPIPSHIHELIPNEAAFDQKVLGLLEERHVPFYNFASTANNKAYFFDTDHLNRTGLTYFFNQHLKAVLERRRA